jgi:SAM-dependent methyltransferase
VAPKVRNVWAIDVSDRVIRNEEGWPENFHFLEFDGFTIPLPDNSVDVAFSSQVMEHQMRVDAEEQITDLCRVLRPGGVLVCVTPNRLTGPHDISRHFDLEPSGFHLWEYTTGELTDMLRRAGFGEVRSVFRVGDVVRELPVGPHIALERALSRVSRPRMQRVGMGPVGHKLGLVNITLSARKPTR